MMSVFDYVGYNIFLQNVTGFYSPNAGLSLQREYNYLFWQLYFIIL